MNRFQPIFVLVPGPPLSIKVVVDSQDAVVVSWLPPDQANGVIVQYNIYVRLVETLGDQSMICQSTTNKYYLNNLISTQSQLCNNTHNHHSSAKSINQ